MLQLNVGEVKYAPARDIVYLYPSVMQAVAARLEDAPFKPLHAILKERGVTLDDLGEAMRCYCVFMNAAHKDPDQQMWDVLTESGWNNCKPEAQIAVMYYAGVLLTGNFFKGVRDVVPLGGRAPATVEGLMGAAKRLDAYLTMPWWKKWIYHRAKWLRLLLLRPQGVYIEV
jgi:hypothetical protein